MSDSPRRRIEPEMMVGVSAVFIGVCALVVSLYEANIMRAEQRASVLPLLELGRSYYVAEDRPTEDWRLEFHAENVGIGPATVKDFRVLVDGKPHQTWNSAMGALLERDADVSYGQSTINGRTVPAGRLVTMFSLRDTELAADAAAQSGRLEFEACFCSVFDECWTTTYSQFGVAVPVEACAADESSFLE